MTVPDPHLSTDRLLMRRMTPADEDNLVELDSDPEVMRYLTGGVPTPRARIRDEVLPRLIRQYAQWEHYGLWATELRATGEFAGWFAMRPNDRYPPDEPELGYRLRRAAWGRGLATEGSLALIEHAFLRAGAPRVHAETMAVNAGSRRVMEKCGMRHVGTRHEVWENPIPGTEQGEVDYLIERSEWLAGRPG